MSERPPTPTVLVLGATSLIGGYLERALAEAGVRYTQVSRAPPPLDLCWLQADLGDPDLAGHLPATHLVYSLSPIWLLPQALGELAKAFGEVKLTPTTFVIDKQGNVVTRILGEPDFARLHALLEQKLGEFNIHGEVTDIRPGPVVTTYEFKPATGVRSFRLYERLLNNTGLKQTIWSVPTSSV